MSRAWVIKWHSGREEVVQAADYVEAHRKAHNRTNWRALGPVFSIGIQVTPDENQAARAAAVTLYRQLLGGEAMA